MNHNSHHQTVAEVTSPELARKVKLFLHSHRKGFERIKVREDCGVITLSGHVGSFYLRQLAIALARRVAGVQRVTDVLQVDVQTSEND